MLLKPGARRLSSFYECFYRAGILGADIKDNYAKSAKDPVR